MSRDERIKRRDGEGKRGRGVGNGDAFRGRNGSDGFGKLRKRVDGKRVRERQVN